MVFSELDVRVTADTGSFERGIDSAERSLSSFNPQALETAAALQVLQGRADEAGDELFDMAPRAATASAGLEGVSLSATGTSAAFSGLAITTVASLVPALVTLSSVLFPIVGALGGFVAVAGAIGGIGIAGAMGAIATNTQQLKTSAMAVAETFKDVFAPVINAATVTISNLLNRLELIAPELAISAETATELGNLFTELGTSVIDLLPALVDLGVTLTEEFLPPFIDFVQDVGPQLPGIIESLVATFERLLPTVLDLGRWLTRFLPEFTEFGFLTLSVITPALSRFGNVVLDTVIAINNLDNGIGGLIAGASILTPVLLGIATLLSGPVAVALGAVVGGVIALSQAWQSNFVGIRDDVARLGQTVRTVLPRVKEAFTAFIQGVDLTALGNSFSSLASTVNTQLSQSLNALRPLLNEISLLVVENKNDFRTFGEAVGFAARGLLTFANVVTQIIGPAFRQILIPIFSVWIDVLDLAINKVATLIRFLQELRSGDPAGVISELNQFFGGATRPRVDVRSPGAPGLERRTEERLEQIQIEVTGDTAVVEDVAARSANQTIQEQSDQAQRNSGTTGL